MEVDGVVESDAGPPNDGVNAMADDLSRTTTTIYQIKPMQRFQRFNRFDVWIGEIDNEYHGIHFSREYCPDDLRGILETYTAAVAKANNQTSLQHMVCNKDEDGNYEEACCVNVVDLHGRGYDVGVQDRDWFISLTSISSQMGHGEEDLNNSLDPDRTLFSFMSHEDVEALLSQPGIKQIGILRRNNNMDIPQSNDAPGTRHEIKVNDAHDDNGHLILRDVNGTEWKTPILNSFGNLNL